MMTDSQADFSAGETGMAPLRHTVMAVAVLFAGLSLAVLPGPVNAQSNEPQTSESESAVVADQSQEEQSKPKPRQLFYPGQPRRGAIRGALMGAPRVITPVPLAIPGTIRPPRDDRRDQNPRFGQVDSSAGSTMPSPETDGASVESLILETEELGLLDPSIQPAGMLSEFQSSLNLWRGISHNEAAEILSKIDGGIQSPALRDIARAMLRGRLDLTPFQYDDEVYDLLAARFGGLRAIADREGYTALAAQFPVEWDVNPVAKDLAKAYILSGSHSRACDIASDQQGADGDGFWLKLATLCSAVSADRTAINFQVGLLQDLNVAAPSFILMVDHILNEAESGVAAEPLDIDGPIAVTFLDAWAWQLSNAQLTAQEAPEQIAVSQKDGPDGDDASSEDGDGNSDLYEPPHRLITENVDPFALQIFLSETGLDAGSRAKLSMLARQAGLPILDYYIAPLNEDDAETPTLIDGWNAALDAGSLMSALDTMSQFAAASVKTNETAAFAGPYIRAALLSGDTVTATSWMAWLRASSAGTSPAIDSALVESWPIMLLAEPSATAEASPIAFETWWAARAEDPTRFEQISLLLGLLSGMGMDADPSLWSLAESGPFEGAAQRPVNPATWRAMMIASEASDLLGVLSLSIKLLGETPVHDMSPAVTIATVSALHNAGFRTAAQQLALEAWIYRGF